MSENLDYSDPQDRVDYKVIKSKTHTSKSKSYLTYLERFVAFSIILILISIIFMQFSEKQKIEIKMSFKDSKIDKLETEVETLKDLVNTVPDKKILTQLETRVKSLENKLKKLENMKAGTSKKQDTVTAPESENHMQRDQPSQGQ